MTTTIDFVDKMLKAEIRKTNLQAQKNLTQSESADKWACISQLLIETFSFQNVCKLHCFLPITRNNEIDTYVIFEKIWQAFPHIETYVPRVNTKTNEIENVRFDCETELALSNWQIHEPSHDETIETAKIDLFLVPLLAFDERGYRVGYGRGFYDRLLANARTGAVKAGLSYFPPVARIDDTNEFDVKLDFCITPEKVWRF